MDSLYDDLPYRCSSCGMRFTNKALLNKHLDWHFQHNMELKEKTKTMNLRPQLITNEVNFFPNDKKRIINSIGSKTKGVRITRHLI